MRIFFDGGCGGSLAPPSMASPHLRGERSRAKSWSAGRRTHPARSWGTAAPDWSPAASPSERGAGGGGRDEDQNNQISGKGKKKCEQKNEAACEKYPQVVFLINLFTWYRPNQEWFQWVGWQSAAGATPKYPVISLMPALGQFCHPLDRLRRPSLCMDSCLTIWGGLGRLMSVLARSRGTGMDTDQFC